MLKKYFFFTGLAFVLILACSNEERKDKKTLALAENPAFIPNPEVQAKVFRLDTLFQHLYKTNQFNGNVLVAQKGFILYQKSFGIANNEKQIGLCDTSLFQLASVSKTITAAAALKLVAAGKLDLKAEVSQYLEGFPYNGVKVEHLITHRSGLPNYLYFSYQYRPNQTQPLNNAEVLRMMVEKKPPAYTKPGLRFNYSNTNYMLLALLIERASGQSFKDYVRKEIFEPANMKHTRFIQELNEVNDTVKTIGYTARMKEVGYDAFDYVLGDKGVFSTTPDMFGFAESFFTGKLFPLPYLQMAIQPYSPEHRDHNYGYGWRMKNFNTPEKLVFHNGWWHGYRTALQRRLKDSTTVVILSNRLNSSVYQTWKIFQALDGDTALPGYTAEEEGELGGGQ